MYICKFSYVNGKCKCTYLNGKCKCTCASDVDEEGCSKSKKWRVIIEFLFLKKMLNFLFKTSRKLINQHLFKFLNKYSRKI